MDAFINKKIVRVRGKSCEETEDLVASEKRVTIAVNGENVLSLYCSPVMIREFVAGIIHNEGLITGEWCMERMSIEYGDEIRVDVPSQGSVNAGERTVTSGCGGGISLKKAVPERAIADTAVFSAEDVRAVFAEFQKKSEAYKLTGGVHSAALADGRRILAFAEDIGRHNAVDKVIGYCLIENIPFAGMIMLASGRLSSEIVSKCVRCGVPVLVSRAAPTSLAVEMAGGAGLTVVGFMRGEKMNIYSGHRRIRL